MSDKTQKLLWMVIPAIVAIILVVWLNKYPASNYQNNNQQSSGSNSQTSEAPEGTPQPGTSTKLSYTQALSLYQGKRIQFTPICQAIPNDVTYKNPVNLMLDNRSNVPQKITIGKVSYNLGAYNFRIVTVSTNVLPQTLYVNCNAQINVARILMQK